MNIAEAFVTLRPDVSDFGRETEQAVSRSINSITGDLLKSGAMLTAGLTLPIVGVGTAALRSSMTFESAFTGVIKTVDATAEELSGLRTGILDMSKTLPASAADISDVAMAAGQLGIQTPNILEFSRVMIDLGEATNLSASDAATQLARLANITGMAQGDFDRLGSTVVALGNNLATTEAEIVQFGLRIAGAGAQVGLSEDQILAWGAALSSVGVDAEAGGTAISRVFVDIANAVADGGDDLAEFARIAGMTSREFTQAFEEDASGAVLAFIEGLGQLSDEGANVFGILDDLSLGNIRVRDALLRSAGAGDLLRESLALGTTAWDENLALTREAELRYGTAESRLAMLKNQFTAAAITLGDALVPVMLRLVDTLSSAIPYIEAAARIFAALPAPVQLGAIAFAALAAAIGPVLIVIGGMASGWAALAATIGLATTSLSAFNLALLANPATAAAVVLTLGAAAVAATVFGNAVADANTEMERSLRISEQTKAQTQEYLFDLQRREQLIRDEIASLQAREEEWILSDGRLKNRNVLLAELRGELDGVSKELSAQEAALASHQKQEQASAQATADVANMMDEMGGAAIGAANDLAQLTPRMVAAGVAARVMRLWMSETLPPMVGMALGFHALVQGMEQVRQAAAMQSGLNGLTDAILGASGAADQVGGSSRSGGGGRSGGSAGRMAGALSDAEKEAEKLAETMKKSAEEVTNWDSRARAAFTAQLLLAQGVTSVAEAMERVNPVVLSMIRGMKEQEELARDLTDALLGVEEAAVDITAEVERAWEALRQESMRDIDTLGQLIVTALQRQHQQALDSRLAVIEAERMALEQAHRSQLSLLERQHDSRMRMLDREKSAALDAIDAQIAALDDASRGDRLERLEEQLLLAWDPRERARIQQEITEFERDEERRRLQNSRSVVEERFRARMEAEKAQQKAREEILLAEQKTALESLDRQVEDARKAYDSVTEAWKLEAEARKLVAQGEMEFIGALIEAHVPEWAGGFQTFSESVIKGPLTDLRSELVDILSLMNRVSARDDYAMKNTWARFLGPGIPNPFYEFDTGGIVPGRLGQPVPILAHGGETVLPTHRRDYAAPAPVVNVTIDPAMSFLRDFIRVEVTNENERDLTRGNRLAGGRA